MTDTIINDFVLDGIAKDYAKEIFSQIDDIDDGYELAHQFADGCDWVKVYHKAHLVCLNCNTVNGQDAVSDCFSGAPMTYDEMGAAYAYCELHCRIMSALNDLFEGI